jgi:hypothetical protein
MKIRSTILALCVVVSGFSFAENDQAVLPYDSPVAGLLRSIYLELGKEPLSNAAPFSVDEVLLMLEKIDPRDLSPAGKRAYEAISAALPTFSPREPLEPHLEIHPSFALEGYLHTNKSRSKTEWEYGYAERQPLASVPLEVWLGEHFYGAVDVSIRKNHDALNEELVPHNYTNLPFTFDEIDYEFPLRAFVALGGPHWSVSLGRDRFSWGNGETGNLAVSDAPDYYDYARATLYWGGFKYTGLWITLLYDQDSYRFPVLGPAGDLVNGGDYNPRNFFSHRVEFCIADRVTLGITEGILVGGVQPDLSYLNPFIIFHNMYRWAHASSLLALEVNYNPWRYFEVYGQAAFNQIQLPYELSRYGGASDTPDANALLAGIRVRVPVDEGYVDAGSEIVRVSPWMYIRENKLISYQWWRWMASNVSGSSQWLSAPLGYYEGPDSIVFQVWLGYSVPDSYSLRLDYKRSVKGSNTLDTPYEEGEETASMLTPTGTAETKNVFHVGGSVEPTSILTVYTDLYLILTDDFANVAGKGMDDFQVVLGVKAKF